MLVVVGQVEEVTPLEVGVPPEFLTADGAWLAWPERCHMGGACLLVGVAVAGGGGRTGRTLTSWPAPGGQAG